MTLLDKDGVHLTADDAIATVTLTNPDKRNAQSPATWRALAEAGQALPGSVRVVVLRAEGKSFSAGLDRQAFTPEGFDGEPSFPELARRSDPELDAAIAGYQEAFT
ncbi:enoyl-CoA hydratase/isomerase family protein, partial [Streptomyces sp. 2MCAF27]